MTELQIHRIVMVLLILELEGKILLTFLGFYMILLAIWMMTIIKLGKLENLLKKQKGGSGLETLMRDYKGS